jgi:hypothetical protein
MQLRNSRRPMERTRVSFVHQDKGK